VSAPRQATDAVEFRIERADAPVSGALIAGLDRDIRALNPGLPVNGIEVAGFEAGGGIFAVGYVAGEPVVCGALRPWQDAIEVKRMYVVPAMRGRGLGKRMLAFLEAEATRRGFARAVLETGNRHAEAIALYTRAGWKPIPVYGPYIGSPISVCFEKRLTAPATDRLPNRSRRRRGQRSPRGR